MQKFIPFLAIVALVPLALVGLSTLAGGKESEQSTSEMESFGPDKYGVVCYVRKGSGGWSCVKVQEASK